MSRPHTSAISIWQNGSSHVTAQGQAWQGKGCCHICLPIMSWSHTSAALTWQNGSYVTAQGQVWQGLCYCLYLLIEGLDQLSHLVK